MPLTHEAELLFSQLQPDPVACDCLFFASIRSKHLPVAAERQPRHPQLHPLTPQPSPTLRPPAP